MPSHCDFRSANGARLFGQVCLDRIVIFGEQHDGVARAVAISATYSPATFKTQLDCQDPKLQCPYCECLGTWDHVAWRCPQSPHGPTRPDIPNSGVARKFGWDQNTCVLSYLAYIQRDIWAKRFPP